MYFDRVVAIGFRLEAYFKGELVALRLRGSNGWVTVPLDRPVTEQEMVWKQADSPVLRGVASKYKPEPKYERFEEAP